VWRAGWTLRSGILGGMADSQLDLFSRKKYTGILPQTIEISPPTVVSTVIQTIPAYHTYLSSGGYSKYTPDEASIMASATFGDFE
jgi:hypothetical protein